MSRTIWDAIEDATSRLEDTSESPQLDAELLLREATGLNRVGAVSYTHLRAHETVLDIVCRLLLEKKTPVNIEYTSNLHRR